MNNIGRTKQLDDISKLAIGRQVCPYYRMRLIRNDRIHDRLVLEAQEVIKRCYLVSLNHGSTQVVKNIQKEID